MAQLIDFEAFRKTRDIRESSEWQDAYEIVDDFAGSLYNRLRALVPLSDEKGFNRDFMVAMETVYAALDRQLDDDNPLHPILDDMDVQVWDTQIWFDDEPNIDD